MTEWLEIKPEEGQEEGTMILIQMPQMQQDDDDEPFRVSRDNDKVKKSISMGQAKQAIQSVTPFFQAVRDSLHELNNPKEIELEFNIGINVDATNSIVSLLVGKASSEASFGVRVKWENDA